MTPLSTVDWIPESWYGPLFLVKGLLALISVVLLIFHMNYEWPRMCSFAQKLRYLALLAYATLIAGSSLEQLDEGIELSYRHLGSIVVTAGLVVAMVVSIRESRRGDKPSQRR